MSRLTLRDRAPLAIHFPDRYEVPKHDSWRFAVAPEPQAPLPQRFASCNGASTAQTRVFYIEPWVGGRGHEWWSYRRMATWQYSGSEVGCEAARVYLNGFGQDHELRFVVRDVTRRWTNTHPSAEVFGASNDFIRVTPGLRRALAAAPGADNPFRTLGARGLYAPTRTDVLIVIAWADTLLARLYGRPHDVDAPGGLNDPLEPVRSRT